jgi:hypothetical protein
LRNCLKIFLFCIGISFYLSSTPLDAQILKDTFALNLVRKDIDYIYNFEFDKSRKVYSEIAKRYPEHPFVFLLRGITTYWENYPLLPKTPSHESFEDDLKMCIDLSENKRNPGYEAEFLLADLCARGMLLMFYADNDMIAEVIPLTITSYKHMRSSFDYAASCTDLYYFTGLYNYYREAYPREFPVYKSLALLFPEGNTETGIKELKMAASGSVVLGPESYYILTWIYLHFENNYSESLYYSRKLHELYPANELYLAICIKNLLLLKNFEDAEVLLKESSGTDQGSYFQAQLFIFNAIIQEKKYQNNELAGEYYNKGIHKLADIGEYGNEYSAYGYYGLSRISKAKGETQAGRIYRNQAEKLAEFRYINFDN